MESCFCITDTGIHIDIKAVPGASKTCAAGLKDNRLRIRIAAAPEHGKANSELVNFIARLLGCAKREVVIINGEKSRLKTIAVPAACLERLSAILPELLRAGAGKT